MTQSINLSIDPSSVKINCEVLKQRNWKSQMGAQRVSRNMRHLLKLLYEFLFSEHRKYSHKINTIYTLEQCNVDKKQLGLP